MATLGIERYAPFMDQYFYKSLEDRYRGSREEIIDRHKGYLPYLEAVLPTLIDPHAMDLGCGRGEWVQLLSDLDIPTLGVDNNPLMIAVCRELGLNVAQEDILEHIKAQPSDTLGIVTAFHVAEHLTFDTLASLVEESLRVLQPGGLLILETPNPENLFVGACQFYLDPTHHHPLPPPLLSFLVEHSGFEMVRVLRVHEQPALIGDLPTRLIDVLSGASPDYAVVA